MMRRRPRNILENLSTDVFEPRTSTGSCIFHSLERFDAIAFITSNRRHENKSFPVHGKEQNHAKKENIRLPVAVGGSKTSVLKFPIMYLDANNLYGWAMSQYLPTGNFKWLSQNQIEKTNLGKYTENSKKGLILEVDLEYPQELHDLHNDYPLGPEQIKVAKDMLSDYCKKIADKFNISSGLIHKLIPTLNDKEKYILHYRNLQSYLSLGLKLKKIHRVLQFDQSPWLKQYIDFNTQKRTHAKNSFEKDFFKLMNNSVFGKTMENIRKRVDVRLVTSKEKLLKLASKPTYVSSKIFNENLVAVHKIKETLTMNRPAYVGMCILDLSKTLMYDFHYNYIKHKYGNKAKLLFTDTDSLTYEIETNDAYNDFFKDKSKFDNSDYPENHHILTK